MSYESAELAKIAINLYLAKKVGGPLAPADLGEDGRMTMWALWSVLEIEAQALSTSWPTRTPPGAPWTPGWTSRQPGPGEARTYARPPTWAGRWIAAAESC